MAINIPIISSLDSKGFDKAIAEFKSLEGASAKTAFASKESIFASRSGVGWFGGSSRASGNRRQRSKRNNEQNQRHFW
jgi:hypothetical protein